MIRLSKAAVAVPLPWPGNCHFLLRAGDVIERAEFEAELAEHGGGVVYDFQLAQALADGLDALLSDLADVERIKELAEIERSADQKLQANEQATLDAARDMVRAKWPAYRALVAQAAKRSELIPAFALQRFCEGWEGADLPAFSKGFDGRVTLDALGALPSLLLRMAGFKARDMLFAGELGNSAPPLQSDKSQAPFTSDTPVKAGSSQRRTRAKKTSSGAKTRSRTSRRATSQSSTSGSPAAG